MGAKPLVMVFTPYIYICTGCSLSKTIINFHNTAPQWTNPSESLPDHLKK